MASVERGQFDVLVEQLPCFTRDGTVVGSEDRFEEAFVDAVNDLAKPGDVAEATETVFGYHVIMLLRRRNIDDVAREGPR